MRYVLAEYASKKESMIKRSLRKAGLYKKFELNDSEIFGTEGFILTLPFLQEETEDFDFCSEQTKKAVKFVKNDYADIEYCLPCEMRTTGGRDGKNTASLAACEKFKEIAQKKDMKYIKTVIIGGDSKSVITVVDSVYDGLNYLAVLAQPDESLDEAAERIYKETGLDIIFITSFKNTVFMDADIIINCGPDISEGANAIKKGATYITFNADKYIEEERKDLNFISLEYIETKEGVFDIAQLEAILCAKDYGYRNFVNSRYYRDKAERAFKIIKDVF